MAPLDPAYFGLHDEYTDDTSTCVHWLTQAAWACGIEPRFANQDTGRRPHSSKGRRKGKARKKGVPASYKISSHEIGRLAKLLGQSESREALLPSGIESVMKRALSNRQKSNELWAMTDADRDAVERHEAFIHVLHECLRVLKPAPQVVSRTRLHAAQSTGQVKNRFEGLEIEDVEDDYAHSPTSNTSRLTQPTPTYEIEELDEQIEDAFARFCYLHDLHRLEDKVREAWQSYLAGSSSLLLVFCATQAALKLAQNLIDQYLARFEALLEGLPNTYFAMAFPFIYADALKTGEQDMILENMKKLEMREVHDFVYMPTAKTLQRFLAKSATHEPGSAFWPPRISPLRQQYLSRPDLRNLPGYMQREQDEEHLMQLLFDVLLLKGSKKLQKDANGDEILPPAATRDELSRCAYTTLKRGSISMYDVFVSQVVLDISKLCRTSAAPKFHDDVDEYAVQLDRILAPTVRICRLGGEFSGWPRSVSQNIINIHEVLGPEILDAGFIDLKKEKIAYWHDWVKTEQGRAYQKACQDSQQQEIKAQGIDDATASREENAWMHDASNIPASDRMFLDNPLHCGSLMLKLSLDQEDIGIELANHNFCVLTAAHLYNALRKSGMNISAWPEMETVIELQKNAIFANAIPTNPVEFCRRLDHRTRTHTLNGKLKNEPLKGLFPPSGLRGVLTRLLEGTEDAAEDLDYELRKIARQKQQVRRDSFQMLENIELHLPAHLRNLQIDYITLARHSTILLRQVRLALGEDWLWTNFKKRIPAEDLGVVNVMMVRALFRENKDEFELHQMLKLKADFMPCASMRTACEAFEEWFGDKEHIVGVEGESDADE